MSARVSDDLVIRAAEALVEVGDSLTNEQGLKLKNPLDLGKAKSAVMGVMANAFGYPHAIQPTGWTEVRFGEIK